MNATMHLRNGRVFRWGFVERLYSDGERVHVYAQPGERVKVARMMVEFDELSSMRLKDVREIEIDDEPNAARFSIVR